MTDVSQTHPDHDTRDWHWFRRGPVVAADGGRDDPAEADDPGDGRGSPERDRDDRDASSEPMHDVSHTPVHGDGANRVWDGTRVYEEDGEDATDDE